MTAESHAFTEMQRKYRTKYGMEAPAQTSIRSGYKDFQSTGSCSRIGGYGRLHIRNEMKELIKFIFSEVPMICLRNVDTPAGLHRTAKWNFLKT